MKVQLISAALAVVLGCAGAAAAQDSKTRDFLKNAMRGDSSEVMLGKLAADQGGSPAAKRFGEMLVDDHSMHLKKVEKVASSMNVSADDKPTDAANSELHKLAMLQGDKFDHELAEYMIKDHRKDISEYEKASRMKGAVGELARATLPTLHKHLSAAEKLKG
jgi:putative membrane protein